MINWQKIEASLGFNPAISDVASKIMTEIKEYKVLVPN